MQDLERIEKENFELRALRDKSLDESLYHEQQYLDIQTKYKLLEAEKNAIEAASRESASFENLDIIRNLQAENDTLKAQIRSFVENKPEVTHSTQIARDNTDKLSSRIEYLDNEGILLINSLSLITFIIF